MKSIVLFLKAILLFVFASFSYTFAVLVYLKGLKREGPYYIIGRFLLAVDLLKDILIGVYLLSPRYWEIVLKYWEIMKEWL